MSDNNRAIVIDGLTSEQADAIQKVLSDGEEEGHLDFAFNTFCVVSSGDVMQRMRRGLSSFVNPDTLC